MSFKTQFLFLLLLLSTIFSIGQNSSDEISNIALHSFNSFLGEEKSQAFEALIKDYDTFLNLSYSSSYDAHMKAKAFLRDFIIWSHIATTDKGGKTWKLDLSQDQKLVQLLETTEMRQEIIHYGYESGLYPLEYLNGEKVLASEIDTLQVKLDEEEDIPPLTELEKREEEYRNQMIWFNIGGRFFNGLIRYAPKTTFMHDYIETRRSTGNLIPIKLSEGILKYKMDYNDPFVKRIIVADIYLRLLLWKLKTKKVIPNE